MKIYITAVLALFLLCSFSEAKESAIDKYRTVYVHQDGRHSVCLKELNQTKEPRVIEIMENELPEALNRECKKLITIYTLQDGRHIAKLEDARIQIVKGSNTKTPIGPNSLTIAPNPIFDASTLTIHLERSGAAEIYAYDCLMNRTPIYKGDLKTGKNAINYDFSGFSKGAITICVYTEGQILTTKAIIR